MKDASKTSEHLSEKMEGKEKATADKVSKNVPTGLGEGASILNR